jgi:hypothetical protein
MVPIHPISEESCQPFYGRHVGVIMNDGMRHYGILSRVHNGQLILNDKPAAVITNKKGNSKVRSKPAAVNNKATISTFGFPYGYGNGDGYGPRTALDLTAIALLFLLV